MLINRFVLKLTRKGVLGRRIQVRAYVGWPEKNEKRNKAEWRKKTRELQEKYEGICLWYQHNSSRPGEYLSWYNVFIHKIGIQTDNRLNVVVDVDSHKENRALRIMMSRCVPVITHKNRAEWGYILEHFNRVDYTGCDKLLNRYDDHTWYSFKDYSELFRMSKEELEYCSLKTKEMGIIGPYVCFANRDSEYLDGLFPHHDYSYHDYRDSNIESRSQMIDYLENAGIQTVRVGKAAKHRFVHANSIDYCFDYYDEWLDIYLPYKAKFSVEDASGIYNIAILKNPNLVLTNYIPLMCNDCNGFPADINMIVIFKLEWSKGKNRFLSMEEMFEMDSKSGFEAQKYCELGVDLVENSAEDIYEVTKEMNERIDGVWEDSRDDVDRQQKFDYAFDILKNKYGTIREPYMKFKIGTRFLEKYWDVLDIETLIKIDGLGVYDS